MSLQILDTEPYKVDYSDTSPSATHTGKRAELIQHKAIQPEKFEQILLTQPSRESAYSISDNRTRNDESMRLALGVLFSHTLDFVNLPRVFVSYSKAIEIKSNEFVDFTELTDALDDLHKTTEEAHEEGFPIPSDLAIRNSEELVKKIYGIFPSRFEVYPTQDGEIAVDIYNGKGSSVILLCDSAGAILCLVNINGNSRRAHYTQVGILPDGFVKEALNELSA